MTQIESFKLPPSFNAYITDPISTLNPTSSINIFVGSNNSGKSRFLRMLSIQTRYEILIKEVSLTSIHSKISNILTEIRILLSNQGLKEANEINEEFINKLIELPEFLNLNSDVFEPWRSTFKRWESLPAITKYVDKQGASLNSNRLEKFKEMLHYKSIEALQILDEIPIYSENIAPPKRVYIPVLRGLRPIDENLTDLYCIKTNHHYFSAVESGCNPPEVFTGLKLYEDIMKMLLGNNNQRKRISEYQQFISNTFFGGNSVTLIPSLDAKVVIVKIGNEKEQPIFHLGDGIQSAIIMSFLPFVTQEPTFFFIEEPEMYLHAGLQRKILDFFAAQTIEKKHMFFLTTHSNHLLDLTIDVRDISIFTFRKQLPQEGDPDEQTPNFIVEAVESGNSSSLELLGVRNSSVFLVNATIWVEGITDRWYLRAMLNSYMKHLKENDSTSLVLEEDVHYSFVEYGGNNITHWSFLDNETHPIKITRLCAKALVVVDKDGDKKLARKEKLEKFLGERLIVLPAREMENILPYKVIKEVILEYEKNPDLELSDEDYSSYQDKYLGAFIEEQMFKGKPISRRGGYKADSGTIKSKPDFCEKALPKIYYQDLPDTTKEVIQKIYEFVRSQNL